MNPCNSCGEDHEPEECFTGFNVPGKNDEINCEEIEEIDMCSHLTSYFETLE